MTDNIDSVSLILESMALAVSLADDSICELSTLLKSAQLNAYDHAFDESLSDLAGISKEMGDAANELLGMTQMISSGVAMAALVMARGEAIKMQSHIVRWRAAIYAADEAAQRVISHDDGRLCRITSQITACLKKVDSLSIDVLRAIEKTSY